VGLLPGERCHLSPMKTINYHLHAPPSHSPMYHHSTSSSGLTTSFLCNSISSFVLPSLLVLWLNSIVVMDSMTMVMNSLQFSTIIVCQDHLFHLATLWLSHFPYPSALSPLFSVVLNVPLDPSTLTLVCLLYHPLLPLATMALGSSHRRSHEQTLIPRSLTLAPHGLESPNILRPLISTDISRC
jgi:hypothetical protein